MKKFLVLICLTIGWITNAQKSEPTYLSNATYLGVSQPLRDLPKVVPTHNNDPANFNLEITKCVIQKSLIKMPCH